MVVQGVGELDYSEIVCGLLGHEKPQRNTMARIYNITLTNLENNHRSLVLLSAIFWTNV